MKRRKEMAERGETEEEGAGLKPIDAPAEEAAEDNQTGDVDADSVFASLGGASVSRDEDDDSRG